MNTIRVPWQLSDSHLAHNGAEGRAWIDALPALAEEFLRRWALRIDGQLAHGAIALVLPVRRADGTPAALKLQPVDDETGGEPLALRTWDGAGAVRLLEHDPNTGTLLLERLDPGRTLASLPETTAVARLAELLSRLVDHQAPAGLRELAGVADAMLARVPDALRTLRSPVEQRLLANCADAVAELRADPGDRLLHWDLHYDNVLAADREPWLAIDPKPLAGDPGFELLPALTNRWPEISAASDPGRAVLRRFDLLTEALTLDRERAAGWTLGRVLQNALWDLEDGATELGPTAGTIAETLLDRRSGHRTSAMS